MTFCWDHIHVPKTGVHHWKMIFKNICNHDFAIHCAGAKSRPEWQNPKFSPMVASVLKTVPCTRIVPFVQTVHIFTNKIREPQPKRARRLTIVVRKKLQRDTPGVTFVSLPFVSSLSFPVDPLDCYVVWCNCSILSFFVKSSKQLGWSNDWKFHLKGYDRVLLIRIIGRQLLV